MRVYACSKFRASPNLFFQIAGFLGRLANPRVLAAALVGGAAAAGVSYHMSNGAGAGAAPGEMRKRRIICNEICLHKY